MKPITVNGVQYPSIVAAWRDLSPPTLKLITLRLRLRNGWNPEDAFWLDTIPPAERRQNKYNRGWD